MWRRQKNQREATLHLWLHCSPGMLASIEKSGQQPGNFLLAMPQLPGDGSHRETIAVRFTVKTREG
jgi:hypothetical protein